MKLPMCSIAGEAVTVFGAGAGFYTPLIVSTGTFMSFGIATVPLFKIGGILDSGAQIAALPESGTAVEMMCNISFSAASDAVQSAGEMYESAVDTCDQVSIIVASGIGLNAENIDSIVAAGIACVFPKSIEAVFEYVKDSIAQDEGISGQLVDGQFVSGQETLPVESAATENLDPDILDFGTGYSGEACGDSGATAGSDAGPTDIFPLNLPDSDLMCMEGGGMEISGIDSYGMEQGGMSPEGSDFTCNENDGFDQNWQNEIDCSIMNDPGSDGGE